jgi:hypothetical protein
MALVYYIISDRDRDEERLEGGRDTVYKKTGQKYAGFLGVAS